MLLAMRWHLPSYADTNPNRPGPMIPTSLLRWYTLHFTFQLGALYLIGSVRNSSVHHGLLHTYKPTFSDFFKTGAILPIYIHNPLSFCALQCSIYRTEPGNTFAWITLKTHAWKRGIPRFIAMSLQSYIRWQFEKKGASTTSLLLYNLFQPENEASPATSLLCYNLCQPEN